MVVPPVLQTKRLRLRPITPADAEDLQRAASEREVAEAMISLPHPYPEGEAERYIARQAADFAAETAVAFALEPRTAPKLGGVVEIRAIEPAHCQAELSFWLAAELWGQGYMSEALGPVLRYGFENLNLNRLYAYHMVRNPGSGRVLQKNGFVQEGLLRQRVYKAGVFEDVKIWAILRTDWRQQNA